MFVSLLAIVTPALVWCDRVMLVLIVCLTIYKCGIYVVDMDVDLVDRVPHIIPRAQHSQRSALSISGDQTRNEFLV